MKGIGTVTIVAIFLMLSGCATPNPFDVPAAEAAMLENTYLNIGNVYYGYSFRAVDKQARGKDFVSLRPGLVSAERDASYMIPGGRRGIKILMVYAPDGIGAFEAQYHLWGYAIVDVQAGKTYRGRGRVLNDKALIWIEDDTGNRVSDKVLPFLSIKVK